MLILTMRTDKPEAEIGLYNGNQQIAYKTWQADRALAETIHLEIHGLLVAHGKDWHDIQGLAVFKGPGSFTGLRIGITVANAIAASLATPIVAAQGDNWLEAGVRALLSGGTNQKLVLPEYGAPPNVSLPRK